MLVVLVAALPHHIQEQDAPLRGVDHVLSRRGQRVGGLRPGRGCRFIAIGTHVGLSWVWNRRPGSPLRLKG